MSTNSSPDGSRAETPFQSIEILKDALSAMLHGALICDTAGAELRILYANPAICELSGYAAEELIGRDFFSLQSDDPALGRSMLTSADLGGGSPAQRDMSLERKGGPALLIRLSVSPVKADKIDQIDNKSLVIVQIHSSELIGQRQLAEDQQPNVHVVLHSIDDVLWSSTPTGNTTYMSPNIQRLLGYSASSLCGHASRFAELVFPDDLSRLQALYGDRFDFTDTLDVEFRIRRADGQWRWMRDRAKVIRNAQGKAVRLDGVMTDITEQKNKEDAYRSRDERSFLGGDNVPNSAVYQLAETPDGRKYMPYVNSGIEQVTGISAAELMADAGIIYDCILDEDRERVLNAEALSRDRLTVFDCEFRARSPKGGVRFLHFRAQPRRLPGGTTIWEGIAINETDQREAEDRLRRSESLLRQVSRMAKVGGWEVDRIHRIPYISDEVYKILELGPELRPLSLKDALKFCPRDARVKICNVLRKTMEQGVPFELDIPIETRMGHLRWVRVHGEAESGKDRWVRLRGAVQDITADRELEEELRKLSHIAKRTTNAVVVTDALGVIEWVNEGFTRISGFTADEVKGKTPELVVSGFERDPATVEFLWRKIHRGEGFRTEFLNRDRTGRQYWVQVEVQPIFNIDGNVCQFISIAQDITDRKVAEEELRRSAEEHRTILSNLQNYVHKLTRAPDGRLLYVFSEGRLAGEFKATMADVAGKTPVECFGEALGSHLQAQYERAIAEGASIAEEIENGGRWFYQIASPLYQNGRVEGVIASGIEITAKVLAERARAKLEERLLLTQKLESLGLLAGGIAHDFNNLLVGVLTEASAAVEELPPDSPVADTLRKIEATARRMSDLTKQLLAYAGRGTLVTEKLDPNRLVAEMLGLLSRSVDKAAHLTVKLSNENALVEADPTQLRQVIMNLVLNASDALSGAPGEIRVRSYVEHGQMGGRQDVGSAPATGYWIVEVSDTGCGMDAETQKRIFDPFFTTKAAGRGLGLSAVQGIVRRLKGRIDVESEPGEGSTFRLVVPLCAGSERRADTHPPGSAPVQRPLRVLLADDEELVRHTVKRLLERRGFSVTTARDGAEALAFFVSAADPFDLVILDVTMPRLGGHEVLKEIRAKRPDARVILASGYTEHELSDEQGHGGADGFLEKPFSREQLDQVIKSVLERVSVRTQ